MKYLFWASLIYLATTACRRDCSESADIYCTDLERSWISYNGGETLIFRDTSGNTDTVVVSQIKSTIETGHQEREDPCSHNYEGISVDIPLKDYPISLGVSHYNGANYYNYNSAGITLSGVQFHFSDYLPLQNYELNGITYHDVFILSDSTPYTDELYRLYYTKINGIIGYDFYHGQKWVKIN